MSEQTKKLSDLIYSGKATIEWIQHPDKPGVWMFASPQIPRLTGTVKTEDKKLDDDWS